MEGFVSARIGALLSVLPPRAEIPAFCAFPAFLCAAASVRVRGRAAARFC